MGHGDLQRISRHVGTMKIQEMISKALDWTGHRNRAQTYHICSAW